MSPEPDGSHYLRVEGDQLICGEKGHDHKGKVVVAGFRVALLELRKRDAQIRQLQEKILLKEGN